MFEKISLNALKFFYFVAKCGSVTKASNQLFVTQSAVSKQIYNLEESIHTCLFERKNKSLRLTLEGKQLYQCCQIMFKELDECLISMQKPLQKSKNLVISCEPTLSMKWLIPRLNQFRRLNSDFDIVLFTGGGKIDFEENKIDLAIRRNDFHWGEYIFHEKIADEYIGFVQSTQQENYKNLLITTSRPNFITHLEQQKPLKHLFNTYQISTFEHFYLCLEACLSNLGSTIVSMYMIEKELKHHFLKLKIPPFKDNSAYYLLSNEAFSDDPRKLIFLKWLQKEMKQSQNLFLNESIH